MKHLRENNETYWSHFRFAVCLGIKLLCRGILLIIHGVFPFLPIPKKYNISDKKLRLIKSAKKLFYEQGINNTTLASIAYLADIPLGNVYYYFKSKESIILSVIEYKRNDIKKKLNEINKIKNVKDRLKRFIYEEVKNDKNIINDGDNIGALCQELCKENNKISNAIANIMKEIINWCKKQFLYLGKKEKSSRYAIILVSNIQGLNLLNFTFKKKNFAVAYSNYLINWIDEIV